MWHRYANYNAIHPEQRLNTHPFSIGVGQKTLRKHITQARIATNSITGKNFACVTTICELQCNSSSTTLEHSHFWRKKTSSKPIKQASKQTSIASSSSIHVRALSVCIWSARKHRRRPIGSKAIRFRNLYFIGRFCLLCKKKWSSRTRMLTRMLREKGHTHWHSYGTPWLDTNCETHL